MKVPNSPSKRCRLLRAWARAFRNESIGGPEVNWTRGNKVLCLTFVIHDHVQAAPLIGQPGRATSIFANKLVERLLSHAPDIRGAGWRRPIAQRGTTLLAHALSNV
jgi:hypothetical protein